MVVYITPVENGCSNNTSTVATELQGASASSTEQVHGEQQSDNEIKGKNEVKLF